MAHSTTFVSLIFLSATLTLSGCNKPGANRNTGTSTAPKPLYTLYRTYDSLAPLLERNSDTLYVINFWATWCAPCVAEMPFFETLHQNMGKEKVKVLLVSLDFEKDIQSKLVPFLKARRLGPDVLLLADNRYDVWINRVNPDWSGAIPATILLKNGKQQFFEESFPSYAALEELVKKNL
ncbi:MAG: hypothetical protein RL386_209 [Bacteroidota bacterium]|jgi:thiol-disulfide isomerase/thioredoxin